MRSFQSCVPFRFVYSTRRFSNRSEPTERITILFSLCKNTLCYKLSFKLHKMCHCYFHVSTPETATCQQPPFLTPHRSGEQLPLACPGSSRWEQTAWSHPGWQPQYGCGRHQSSRFYAPLNPQLNRQACADHQTQPPPFLTHPDLPAWSCPSLCRSSKLCLRKTHRNDQVITVGSVSMMETTVQVNLHIILGAGKVWSHCKGTFTLKAPQCLKKEKRNRYDKQQASVVF